MSEHPKDLVISVEVNVPLDLELMAELIEELQYDKTLEFIARLKEQFIKRAKEDRSAGKEKLADALTDVATSLSSACDSLSDVWDICKSHMTSN